MRSITLRDGELALVDPEDFDELSKHEWSLHTGGYAQRRSGLRRIYMHQVIGGKFADHANGNKLDNRRDNLRTATKSENAANSKVRSDNTSGYRGVTYFKPAGLWRARVKVLGREHSTYHASAEEAARARDAMATKAFGSFARLNFPEGTP